MMRNKLGIHYKITQTPLLYNSSFLFINGFWTFFSFLNSVHQFPPLSTGKKNKGTELNISYSQTHVYFLFPLNKHGKWAKFGNKFPFPSTFPLNKHTLSSYNVTSAYFVICLFFFVYFDGLTQDKGVKQSGEGELLFVLLCCFNSASTTVKTL